MRARTGPPAAIAGARVLWWAASLATRWQRGTWALVIGLSTALPLAFIVVSAQVVASALAGDFRRAYWLSLLLAGLYLCQHAVGLVQGPLQSQIAATLERQATARLVQATLVSGQSFEVVPESELVNARASLDGRVPPRAAMGIFDEFATTWLQTLTAFVLLTDLGLLVPLAALLALAVYRRAAASDIEHFVSDASRATAGYGTAGHLRDLALSDRHMTELRLLRAREWLPAAFSDQLRIALSNAQAREAGRSKVPYAMALVFVAYCCIAYTALQAALTGGDIDALVRHLQALTLASNLATVRDGQLNLPELRRNWTSLHRLPLTTNNQGPETDDPPLPCRFELRHATYAYPDAATPAVQGLSLTLQPGMIYGVVGENGAGKTTLAHLLMGHLAPTSGSVLRTLAAAGPTLLHHVAYLAQDPFRVQATLPENVTLDDRPDEEQAKVALPLVQRLGAAPADVLDPGGAGSGVSLSRGQWQQVAIARVRRRAAHAALTVLDEPTSALDPEAEREFTETLRGWPRVGTTVLVGHRLSVVRFCDEILVLEAGRLLERGNHDALLSLGGKYADMYRRQAGMYPQPPP